MGGSLLGGITSAFGAEYKADAQSAMYQYKAGVAQANAKIAQQNVQYALEEGQTKEQMEGLAGGQRLGQIRTDLAASGLRTDTGSAANVIKSQIAGIQEGEQITAYDAAKKAYGYSVQAADFLNEQQMDIMSAKTARTAGMFDVASSLLGGATSVSDKWMKFGQAGVPGFGSLSS